jgi:hypothetical protein
MVIGLLLLKIIRLQPEQKVVLILGDQEVAFTVPVHVEYRRIEVLSRESRRGELLNGVPAVRHSRVAPSSGEQTTRSSRPSPFRSPAAMPRISPFQANTSSAGSADVSIRKNTAAAVKILQFI